MPNQNHGKRPATVSLDSPSCGKFRILLREKPRGEGLPKRTSLILLTVGRQQGCDINATVSDRVHQSTPPLPAARAEGK
jgi:hypothetical protein